MHELNEYGITLRKLTRDKIEMIRIWRNDPKISMYMKFRGIIMPEMQEKWFNNIDNENNYFYLIVVENEEIGLVNVKDVDFDKQEGEAGIYIYDDRYLNSGIGFKAALIMYGYVFEQLNLTRLSAHILSDNRRAIKYNKFLGFKIAENQENIKNQKYILSKKDFDEIKNRLNKLL